jgi:ankyrin repeat protein
MDDAAAYGHLHVIQYLHENRKEGCTKYAMDSAAAYGHLPVIQYLHENRKEGCTTRAMNWAAENGHLHVIQYLHENRSEGCTTDAMNWAAARGHLDVFEYLYKTGMPYTDNVKTARVITTMKEKSARIIQAGCENWLYKPMGRDGKPGIHMKLGLAWNLCIS